ncbi:MAG: RNA-protein complex protein Nop10 [Candidatus Woesearchaeota archaeon]
MSKHILYCSSCKEFTMKENCPKCGAKVLSTKPAKFSPEDKWGKYRRMAKK